MAERSSVHMCLALITDMQVILRQARKSFGSQDNVIVNRRELSDKLDDLRRSLPETLATAREYVDNYEQIQQQARQDCDARRAHAEQESARLIGEAQQALDAANTKLQQVTDQANAQAKGIIDQANAQAQGIVEQVNTSANTIVEAARQEAQRIISDAAAKAEQLVEQEEILRRARITATEVQADTQQELTEMRRMTFDYLDRVMEHVDRFLSDRLTEMRRERTELNNHR